MPPDAVDPTVRFTSRAADYARHRPDYPSAAIDAVLEGLGPPSKLTAADVGAGTGIFARALADRGARVLAVEPNEAMRSAAEPHPRVEHRDGTAEATGLGDASVDVVTCAQAFHWFRHDEAVRELHRILKPRGRLAIVWNVRDSGDALTRAYGVTLRAAEHEVPDVDPRTVVSEALFTLPELVTFRHSQALDLDSLMGRAFSSSYVPQSGPEAERIRAELVELHAAHRDAEGRVVLRYITEVWRARRE